MTDKHCSIIFRGDIVIGKNLPEVKQKLKKIFNVDDEKIDSLFIGRPVPLKTKLSLSEAEKYKRVLEQAGIVVSIESNTDQKAAPTKKISTLKKQNNAQDNRAGVASADAPEWQLAPAGSLLQDKKAKQQESRRINVDHLSVTAQEGNLIKDNERIAVTSAAINTDVLDWELTPYGEALLKEAEKKKVQAVEIDTASLSVLENEGDLLKESEKKKVESVSVDISHISLVLDQ